MRRRATTRFDLTLIVRAYSADVARKQAISMMRPAVNQTYSIGMEVKTMDRPAYSSSPSRGALSLVAAAQGKVHRAGRVAPEIWKKCACAGCRRTKKIWPRSGAKSKEETPMNRHRQPPSLRAISQ